MIEPGKTTDIIAGWVSDSNGVAMVNAYAFTEQELPANGEFSDDLAVFNISGIQSNGITTIFFTRPIHAGSQSISEETESYVIGAYSEENKETLSFHGDTRTQSIIQVNFYSGISKQTIGIKDVHAILMFISWGLILPFGVLCARYLRASPEALWFKIHQPCQYGGFVISLAGIIMGYIMVGNNQFRVLGHSIIGTIILVLSAAQVVSATFRPHKDIGQKVTTARLVFEIGHHTNGRLLVILAVVQIFLGIYAIGYDSTQPWLIPTYGTFVAVTSLIVIIVEAINCVNPFGKIVPCLICFGDDPNSNDYALAPE